jgi:hypothetical protein
MGFFFLAASVVTSYYLLEVLLGQTEALLGTLAWMTGLQFLLDGGNTVEFFNLLFQFGCLYSFMHLLKSRKRLYGILLGALSGLSFLLRPNEIGTLISISLYCLYRMLLKREERPLQLRNLIIMFTSFFVTLLAVCLFLYFNGAFSMFVDDFIYYNFLYTKTGTGKLLALFFGIYHISPLFILAMSLWIFFLIRKPITDFEWKGAILNTALILFGLEIWLSTLSNQPFAHYFVSWLPAMSLIIAFGIHPLINSLETAQKHGAPYVRIFTVLVAASAVMFTSMNVWPSFSSFVSPLFKRGVLPALDINRNPDKAYVEYVVAHTSSEDFVWFWGNEVIFNIQTGRRIPSRLIYPYPLGTPGYATPQLVNATIQELRANPPAIIVDAAIDPLLPLDSQEWEQYPIVWPLIEYIRSSYRVTTYIGRDRFPVWTYLGKVQN